MLWFDQETFSATPITHGTYKYAANCEVLLVTYAIDDQPVQCWDATADPKMPGDLEYVLMDTDELVCAHNSMFDRTVLRTSRNLKIDVPVHRWHDTMVQALSHSLPGGLDLLCDILQIPQDQRKLKTGRQLINLFCKPRPKNSKVERATRLTHPGEWAEFIEYAKSDIDSMRQVYKRLPSWNYSGAELALWRLDQRINDRGVCVDVDLARAAIRAVDREQKVLAKRTMELTNNEVESATKRDKLLLHILAEYGVDLPDMQGSTVERRIADPDLPAELRELLSVRLQASTTSTSKYKALVNGVSDDGRLRGTLQFNGANRTGRWAGRTFQPQNLPRPTLEQEDIDFGIEALKADAEDMLHTNVMELTSSSIRGCIIAPPGKKLVISDLSNIEGRMCAWLAGESWKLNAFREFDQGKGHDLYKVAYAKAFRISPEDVTKYMRQIGKVMELMLQYEGGVGAFITGAATYGIDLQAMADAALPTIAAEVFEEAAGFYDWSVKQKRNTFGLPRDVFIACDSLKRLWRMAHPQIVNLWREVQSLTRQAIEQPGRTFAYRALKFRRDGAWLRIALPSGRCLCYPSPQLDDEGKISYFGINQYTRKWQRLGTYSGKLVENITQAAARDVLAGNMPQIEDEGYELILSVHDENLTEAPDTDAHSAARLSELMATVPLWAPSLPLASAGFETYRYKKD
jgi:DNA polymerase bacteriophage-type